MVRPIGPTTRARSDAELVVTCSNVLYPTKRPDTGSGLNSMIDDLTAIFVSGVSPNASGRGASPNASARASPNASGDRASPNASGASGRSAPADRRRLLFQ